MIKLHSTPLLIVLAASFLMAACSTTEPIYVPLSPSHPASPYAQESPLPARSSTLAINQSEIISGNPNWQIPGMRDNEKDGHAAGPVPGGMMHDMDMGSMKTAPAGGNVKMEAAADQVDYAPDSDTKSGTMKQKSGDDGPEKHLKSGGKASSTSESGGNLAPSMDNMEGMDNMDGMKGMNHEHPSAPESQKMTPPDTVQPKKSNTPDDSQPGSLHDMDNMPGMHH